MSEKYNPNEWKPTAKQAKFLSLRYDILEGFYAGAVMAGKSDVLLAYPIIHRWHENPRFKGIFFRRTHPELAREIVPRSSNFYRQLGATYNKSDKVWSFPNKNHSMSPMGAGALLFFGHCENEDDVHNYDSMQINYAAFDELTSFTEWQYLYITLQRVRSPKGSDLPAIVRSASNPGNIGHGWVRQRFIDAEPDGSKVLQNKHGLRRIYIKATVADNPYVSDEYIKSLESLPEAEKRAKLYGDWGAYDGQVFSEFRDRSFPDEPDNALHVIKPFDIPVWWPRIIAMDWGYRAPAMTWIGFGAISPERRLYLYKEFGFQEKKIEEWGSEVKPFIDEANPRMIKLCQSAGQDRGQDHTIHQQITDALGRPVDLTSNFKGSRVAGKMLMHEYLRWKPRFIPAQDIKKFDNEYAEKLLRNRGIKEYNSYLSSFKPQEPELNLPKLQVFENCPLFINAIKSCVYEKKEGNRTEDVAEFPGDDPYDGGRYLVDAADRFFDEASFEMKEIERRTLLEKHLRVTGDMTAFYRNARQLEAENKTYAQPIMRFRHR